MRTTLDSARLMLRLMYNPVTWIKIIRFLKMTDRLAELGNHDALRIQSDFLIVSDFIQQCSEDSRASE